MSKHTAMVIKAARVLNQRTADECGVNAEDQWKYYSESFISDAEAILEAAGAPELLEALEKILSMKPTHGMNPNAKTNDPPELKVGWNVHTIARNAIAKARGEANE